MWLSDNHQLNFLCTAVGRTHIPFQAIRRMNSTTISLYLLFFFLQQLVHSKPKAVRCLLFSTYLCIRKVRFTTLARPDSPYKSSHFYVSSRPNDPHYVSIAVSTLATIFMARRGHEQTHLNTGKKYCSWQWAERNRVLCDQSAELERTVSGTWPDCGLSANGVWISFGPWAELDRTVTEPWSNNDRA